MKQIGLDFGRAILSMPRVALIWYEKRQQEREARRMDEKARAQEMAERRKKWSEFAANHIAQRDEARTRTQKQLFNQPVQTPQETLEAVNDYWHDVRSGVATPEQSLCLQQKLRVACERATTPQLIKQDLETIVASNSLLKKAERVNRPIVEIRKPMLAYIASKAPELLAGLATGTAGVIAYAGLVLSVYRGEVDSAFAKYGITHIKSLVQQSEFWMNANHEVTDTLLRGCTTAIVTLPIAYGLLLLNKWYHEEKKADTQARYAVAAVNAGNVAASQYQAIAKNPENVSIAKVDKLSVLIDQAVEAAQSLSIDAYDPVVTARPRPARLNYLSKYFSKARQLSKKLAYNAASVLMSL